MRCILLYSSLEHARQCNIAVPTSNSQNLQSLWESFQVSYSVHYWEDQDTLSMRKKLGHFMGGVGFLVKQELKFSLHINFPSMFNSALFYHAYLLHSFFPFQPNVNTSPGKFIESKHQLLFCIYTPQYYVSASNSFW
jgi:hypothetical protein